MGFIVDFVCWLGLRAVHSALEMSAPSPRCAFRVQGPSGRGCLGRLMRPGFTGTDPGPTSPRLVEPAWHAVKFLPARAGSGGT